ncbi:MAG: thiopurine S-methyltransferase [Bacteroidota bacterium]
MEISYWQSRWNKDKTGFHLDQVYAPLKKHWRHLQLQIGDYVLVPLCGKSLDMHWMMQQEINVVGVEVSEKALFSFFRQFKLEDQVIESQKGSFTIYRVHDSQWWVGDIHKLQPNWLPTIHAVYDKAAIVALRPDQRTGYIQQIKTLCPENPPMLIQTFDYPQQEMPGPPFSVPINEIQSGLGECYSIQTLEKRNRLDDLEKFKRRGLHTRLDEYVLLLRSHAAI